MKANCVSIATDFTSGPGMHVVYGFPDFFEQAAPMNWAPGAGLKRHSLAANVLHKNERLVLDGHDLGPLLGHQPINFFMHSLKSSRKTVYAASTVTANGKPIACADCTKGTPMIVCGDPVALPYGWNDNNVVHIVMVGMTELDYFKGDVAVAVSIAVDTLAFVASVATFNPASGVADAVKGVGMDVGGVDLVKTGLGATIGLAGSVAVSYKSGWKEPITYKAEAGSSYAGASAEIAYTPGRGVQHKVSVTAAGVKGEVETDWSSKVKVAGSHWGNDKPAEKTWGQPL